MPSHPKGTAILPCASPATLEEAEKGVYELAKIPKEHKKTTLAMLEKINKAPLIRSDLRLSPHAALDPPFPYISIRLQQYTPWDPLSHTDSAHPQAPHDV